MKTVINATLVKETEKALLLNCCVSYNDNCSFRQLWFPKSACEQRSEDRFACDQWIISKNERANAFKGYLMQFAFSYAE